MENDILLPFYEQCKQNYYNKVQKITTPLRQHLNVNYFSYQRLELDGRYSLIANRPDFLEYYITKKFYAYDPFLVSPHCYNNPTKMVIISDEICKFDENTKSTILEIGKLYGFYDSLLFIIKNVDSIEIFVVSTSIKNNSGLLLLINERPLLEKFFVFFKKSMWKELNHLQDISVNMAEYKNVNFREKGDNLPAENRAETAKELYLEKVVLEEYKLIKNMRNLSSRENECLYWLVHGKTAEETAKILNISRRTVEVHREKCRHKLGTHYSYANLIYLIGKYQLIA